MIFSSLKCLLLFTIFTSTLLKAEDESLYQVGNITVKDVWVRPSCVENSAAYLIIENKGNVLDQLVGAETDMCKHVELHRIEEVKGVFRMRAVKSLDIPGGSITILKPGGMHVMLMKLRHPLKVGEKIDLTLIFAKAGKISLKGNIQSNSKAQLEKEWMQSCDIQKTSWDHP